jgi:hypothetical protein
MKEPPKFSKKIAFEKALLKHIKYAIRENLELLQKQA